MRASEKAGQADQPRSFVGAISPKSKGNWAICKSQGLWGFTKAARHWAKVVKPGDFFWFYLGGSGFVALAQLTSTAEPIAPGEPAPWPDGRDYTHKVHLVIL